MQDYYSSLQISRNASQEEIKKAYRRLAKKYHPDFDLQDQSRQRKMREINEAYRVLRNQKSRKKYDVLCEVKVPKKEVSASYFWTKESFLYHIYCRITNDAMLLIFLFATILGLLIYCLIPSFF